MKTRYIKHRGLYKPLLALLTQLFYEFYNNLPWVKRRKQLIRLYWTGNMVLSSKSLQGVIHED